VKLKDFIKWLQLVERQRGDAEVWLINSEISYGGHRASSVSVDLLALDEKSDRVKVIVR
jgi:hypothetical protein